jgi:hypothetical protein
MTQLKKLFEEAFGADSYDAAVRVVGPPAPILAALSQETGCNAVPATRETTGVVLLSCVACHRTFDMAGFKTLAIVGYYGESLGPVDDQVWEMRRCPCGQMLKLGVPRGV